MPKFIDFVLVKMCPNFKLNWIEFKFIQFLILLRATLKTSRNVLPQLMHIYNVEITLHKVIASFSHILPEATAINMLHHVLLLYEVMYPSHKFHNKTSTLYFYTLAFFPHSFHFFPYTYLTLPGLTAAIWLYFICIISCILNIYTLIYLLLIKATFQ